MPSFDLSGRGALVTGSTQGIGLGIARGLQEAGANVIFHGKECDPEVGSACLPMDLTLPSAPRLLMERAFALMPRLDILVCNAGGFFDVPFLDMAPQSFDKTFALNVRAPFFLAQAFARELVQQKRPGSIILVASTNGLQAEPNSAAYDTSKGSLIMMARTLALSLADHNIRVNALAPGLIRTPLTSRWLDSNPEKREHYEKNIPLGRVGAIEDCAGTVVFLASDAGSYITGQHIVVDGGLTSQQIGPI